MELSSSLTVTMCVAVRDLVNVPSDRFFLRGRWLEEGVDIVTGWMSKEKLEASAHRKGQGSVTYYHLA